MPSPTPVATYGIADLDEFRARLAELRAQLAAPHVKGAFVAHTDGACLGNPSGPGGWAAVVESGTGEVWELYGHLSSTSNNRAEALGVLAALEWIPDGSSLLLRSDSELTVKILLGAYKAKANSDIWAIIRASIARKSLSLRPEWVRGHAGDPGNERADRLSVLGATGVEQADVGPRRERALPPELQGVVPQGDWEQQFVRSIADQLRKGRVLSQKQQAVLDRIKARVRG